MCLCLRGMAPRGATSAELLGAIGAVTDWARSRGIRLSSELESGDDTALSATVDTLVESGLLTRYEAGSEIVYSIDPAKHPMASYYRNIIAHHFLERAMIERSEKRRVGKGCVSTCRSWWSQYLSEK